MKKILTILFTLLTVISCTAGCLAAEESRDVLAKYIGDAKRTEISVSGQTEMSVKLPDDTQVTVKKIPSDAARLIIYAIPASETEAWAWIRSCFEKKGTPVQAFDIYFADAEGNRLNAGGAVVTIAGAVCSGRETVYSLTTDGQVETLDAEVRSGAVSFVTNGSHYYIMEEKAAETEQESETETSDIESESDTEAVGGNIGSSMNGTGSVQNPATGDESNIMLWSLLAMISGAALVGTGICFGRRNK